jgi:CRISPR/Cas system-associated protein Cas7 (RAMP superfamily)
MDRINVAQDRERWQALLDAVMNLQAQSNAGNVLSPKGLRTTDPIAKLSSILLFYTNNN